MEGKKIQIIFFSLNLAQHVHSHGIACGRTKSNVQISACNAAFYWLKLGKSARWVECSLEQGKIIFCFNPFFCFDCFHRVWKSDDRSTRHSVRNNFRKYTLKWLKQKYKSRLTIMRVLLNNFLLIMHCNRG